jgi:formylglycine-generating enzyme required for sulfatase activity
VQRIRQWLILILTHSLLPTLERALAGDILGRLGDPRPGVGLRADGLPDLVWCRILAGPFVMGSDPHLDRMALGNEQPQHQVDLPEFLISRYAITQSQYHAFVEAGGYQATHYWPEAQAAGYWRSGQVKRVTVRFEGGDIKTKEEWAATPAEFGAKFSLSNHPVVGVNWYEAIAFCRWLTEQLHQAGELASHEIITLPSESQWEKAARGTDGRIYPWGNEADPNRANFTETGLGAPSAVGCFPGGQSPYGCEDVSGNVGEWCRSRRREYTELEQDDDDLTGYSPRVVRGGGFNNYEPYVRCAVRIWNLPDDRDGFFGFRVVRE